MRTALWLLCLHPAREPFLARLGPDFDVVGVERWRITASPDVARAEAPRRLAHGDFHPGNVLVDTAGGVAGVIDFGVQAVMGDPLLDLTSAAFFFDDKADRAYAASQAAEVEGFEEATRLYWLYYSFFYLSTKTAKPALYDLCVRSLNAAVEA